MKRFIAVAALLLAPSLQASARLTYLINGKPTPIAWGTEAFPIQYTIDQSAAAHLPDAQNAISEAFDDWQTSGDSIVQFRGGAVSTSPAGHDGRNSVSVSDGLFASSGFIAFTTTWFDDYGKIVEADVQVDPSASSGHNVKALVQHEVGHLLGLDHSAVLSAVMFPYVNDDSPNSLDRDDLTAIASIYPAPGFVARTGKLRGTVRSNTGGVFGAQIVALDASGSPVASALSDVAGNFEIGGIPGGNYQLYVEPLDGPVGPENFSGVYRNAQEGEFKTEFLSSPRSVTVRGGGVVDNLEFRGDGPVTLNPKWIGTFAPGSNDVRLGSTVNFITAGQTVCIAVGGDGIIGGMTQFDLMSSQVKRISDFQYGQNYVWATFQVAPGIEPASLVVLATNGNENATLTGGIRILPASGSRRRAVQ
jgi:hypothetical protein